MAGRGADTAIGMGAAAAAVGLGAVADLERSLADGSWRPADESDPRIEAWHTAYRSFGTNPRRVRPSVDALGRRRDEPAPPHPGAAAHHGLRGRRDRLAPSALDKLAMSLTAVALYDSRERCPTTKETISA
ncbi:hypothetical protein [Streptomyces sp. NPDC056361]|uniref:hypothetical protein n=1 Tax=Streptomyces sp. NPDC056361 TaxID=3345795 RepID=UPI0035E22CD2